MRKQQMADALNEASTVRRRFAKFVSAIATVVIVGVLPGRITLAANPAVPPRATRENPLTNDTFIEVNGQRYFVRDTQKGNVAVLLVHGMPDDGSLWRHQIPALAAAGYRVIAADNLGTGQSARPSDPARYRSDVIIADFAGILDALSIKKVHYVGHDVGAGLGWQFVMTYPDRVLSFVTMTVGHPASLAEGSFTTEGARLSWYLMVNQTPVWGELWRAGNGRLARTALGSHPDVEEVLPHMLQPGVLESYMMIDRVNPITDFLIAYANGALPEMPSVHVPVFGIAGTKDQFMWRSQIENSGKYVKGPWRFAAVDAGHWIPLDAPRQTNKLLLDWLSQQRTARWTVE